MKPRISLDSISTLVAPFAFAVQGLLLIPDFGCEQNRPRGAAAEKNPFRVGEHQRLESVVIRLNRCPDSAKIEPNFRLRVGACCSIFTPPALEVPPSRNFSYVRYDRIST